jgi:hypothetical protein
MQLADMTNGVVSVHACREAKQPRKGCEHSQEGE